MEKETQLCQLQFQNDLTLIRVSHFRVKLL